MYQPGDHLKRVAWQQKAVLIHSSSVESCGVLLLLKRRIFWYYNSTLAFLWVMLCLCGSEVPIKSLLQQVNRSTVFPQVLISPLGRSSKLETEADDRGEALHSVVGSKSTAVTCPTHPDPMTSLPLNLPVFPPLSSLLFSFTCIPLWQVPSLSSSHSCASTLDFI